MTDIYIPIEIKARDLISNLKLISTGLEDGFTFYIGSKKSIDRVLENKKQKSGIFVSKTFMVDSLIKKILTKCEKYCVLDYEFGYAMTEKEIKQRAQVLSRFILNDKISNIFLLDDKIKSHILNVLPTIQKKVLVTGWPRYDLTKKDYENIYSENIKKIKKKYNNFFLFSSDFGILNNNKIKELTKYYKSYGWSKSAINKETKINKRRLFSFKLFLKSILKYEKSNDLQKLIIRPHPSENQKVWSNIKKTLYKTKIILEGEIEPWIIASNGLISNGCSSTIDALIFQKKTFYLKLNGGYLRKSRTFHNSILIKSLKDLTKYNDINIKKNNIKINKSSSKIICKVFKSYKLKDKHMFKIKTKDKFFYKLKDIYQNFFLKKKNFDNKMQTGLKKKEIVNFIHKMSKVNFKVEKVMDNCFRIEKEY
jgi:surface carbohydrate biosynthesis protein